MSRKNEGNDQKGSAHPLPAKKGLSLVDAFPLLKAREGGAVELPEVKAPSLEKLEVRVPKPAPVTEDDLAERFHELMRAHAPKRDRAPGEPVAMGDDVLIDVVGYAEGKLIPFSARTGVWMEVGPIPALPGFAEAIEGAAVESFVEVRLELPEDYPIAAYRGVPATFLITVQGAREVKMPNPEDPAFLETLGRGGTLGEVMDSLIEEMEEELADQLWIQAQDMVLDEVARRADVVVPSSLVDEEIRRRWGQTEGRQLAEMDFDPNEQDEALQGWLRDPTTRADAERRLKVALALKAVAEKEKLELTAEKLKEILEEAGEAFGVPLEEARKALETDSITGAQVKNTAWHLMAVGYVMDKAKVHFEGGESAGAKK